MVFRNDFNYNGKSAYEGCVIGLAFSQDGFNNYNSNRFKELLLKYYLLFYVR
jgi:hypothetical protein